jgi:NAD(P)-dependent dehydrogenase (short-subunit alcohol dehydrogenase family)
VFSMTDKVSLITGSTKGIGKAIAEQMSKAGAKVVISSRKADACDKVAADIRAAGGEAIAVPCNISHRDQLETLVETTLQTWGRVDALVCNAAVNPYYGPFLDIPDDAFDKSIAVNVRSNMLLSNLVLPQMKQRREGSITIISSIAGLKGSDMLGTYALTKAADMQMARNLAVGLGEFNIRANCIAPGLVKTDFARALWEDPEKLEKTLSTYPLGRLGEPDDIAGAAVFLASRAGAWLTGQTLVIDGGWAISA